MDSSLNIHICLACSKVNSFRVVDWNKLKVLNQKRRSCGLFKRNKSGEGREAAEKGKRIEDWEGRGGEGGCMSLVIIINKCSTLRCIISLIKVIKYTCCTPNTRIVNKHRTDINVPIYFYKYKIVLLFNKLLKRIS